MNELFNNDAEVAYLSILLKNTEKVFEIKSIKPFMFSSTPNKELFKFIDELSLNGIVPEFNMILNGLKAANKLDQIGGIDYLNYLFNQNFEVNNFKGFEKLIINSYKARVLLSISGQIPNIITEDKIDDAISFVRNSLDNLSLSNGGEDTLSIEDISREAWNDIVEATRKDNKIAFTTGFESLNAVTGGYVPGDTWIIAGRPGMGKSAFMCNSVLSGIPSLIFSLEMSKKVLMYRLLGMKTGIPVFNIRFGLLTQKELDLISTAVSEIKKLPIYIDTNYSMDIDYAISTVKKYKKLHSIQVVHLDYVQLLAERSGEATHDIGKISRRFKLIDNDLEITSIIYSQLNRLVEMREDKRPILSDLRQSGDLEQDADIAVFLYRDVMYNSDTKDKDLLELLIRKQRNGPVGMIPVTFNKETNRIIERN